ncbi:unnamed protein product [Toxocara canis]|uniref:Uncharacterized protein n=1 Tax=Toxocara canis TaxID=6265 RepID=A0A183TZP4_TOXCA|nr:unnamed protein product [Toxocara canis]
MRENEDIISCLMTHDTYFLLICSSTSTATCLRLENEVHEWVTNGGKYPMPSESENCHLVTVTQEEIENCVRIIPRLDTLILVKAMGHRKRFGNPFRAKDKNTSSVRIRKTASVKDANYGSSNRHDITENSEVERRYKLDRLGSIEVEVEGLSLCGRAYEGSRAPRSISQAAAARH